MLLPRIKSGLENNFQMARPLPPVQDQVAAPADPQGLLSRIGGGLKNMVSNPNFYDSMAIGLGGMTTNPNTGLIKMSQDRIAQRGKLGNVQVDAQNAINSLMSMKPPETQAANMIRNNPSMADQIFKEVLLKNRKGASPTAGPVYTNQETGQQYRIVFNPDKMTNEIQYIDGAFQETEREIREYDTQSVLDEKDYEEARGKGVRAYDQLLDLKKNTSLLQEARLEVMAGAKTGLLYGSGWIPAFTKETARLSQITKMMGINVINSATFGALSEKEMALALSVDIDRTLPKDELLKLLDQKIAAQEKLQREIGYYAERLNTGRVKYSDFVAESIQRQRTFDARNVNRKAQGVANELWEVMTADERANWDD